MSFPEPLYSDGNKALYAEYLASIASWLRSEQVYSAQSLHLHNNLPIGEAWWQKKGLVVIGSLPLADAQAALVFAKRLGWPVLCDVQSGVSSEWAGYDLWLQNPKASAQLAQAELVVQFGSRLRQSAGISGYQRRSRVNATIGMSFLSWSETTLHISRRDTLSPARSSGSAKH